MIRVRGRYFSVLSISCTNTSLEVDRAKKPRCQPPHGVNQIARKIIRQSESDDTSSHLTASSTIQSFGLRTSKRIARKARVFERFAIERGPGERSRRPDSAESSKTYPSAIQPRSADYCLRFACWPGHQDGSNDLAPSFIKRRDRRCRKCFSERYGSATPARKAKVKKK